MIVESFLQFYEAQEFFYKCPSGGKLVEKFYNFVATKI